MCPLDKMDKHVSNQQISFSHLVNALPVGSRRDTYALSPQIPKS